MPTDIEKLVDAWFGKPDPASDDPSFHDNFAASDRLDELISSSPLEGWGFILEANNRPYSEKQRSMLAAGPLENLLGAHGATLISKVELEAKQNPRFKALLKGVWKGSIPEPIWARVQAARE